MLREAIYTVLVAVATTWLLDKWFPGQPKVKVTTNLNDSYDYIVVGSGAGSVVAARLAEKPGLTVLLLEAGGHYDENPASYVPGQWYKLLHTGMDWDYYTEPQENVGYGLNDKKVYWPRGRVLGGSGVINLLQYTRGSRYDFDEWEKLGCTGWSYKDVLPYFKKSEEILIPDLVSSQYHGTNGPMGVSSGNVSDLTEHYLKAGQELGYDVVDYNGENQEGFSLYQLHIKNGVRSITAKEYLSRVCHQDNIHIAIRSHVTKIEIVDKRATGVFVIRDNRKVFIKANKEVIVAGGAINSPQLLMLSGIGPRKQLKKLGIPVVADLPVGENLQDHNRVQLFTHINKPLSITPDMTASLWSRLRYTLFGQGVLGKTLAEVTAFLHTDPEMRGKAYTDLQINIFSSYQHANVESYNDTYFNDLFSEEPKKYGFMSILILNHLKSKGTIRLKSSDAFDTPIIEPNYLSEQSDVEDFIRAIRIWEKFIETPSMKSLGASVDQTRVKACEKFEFRSDEYWECHVRHFFLTTYHPCCTCKMGSVNDNSTVVDPTLRVKGVKGLRVVDASAFPQETSGNLNAPIIMLAEKAADLILGSQ